MPKTPPKTQPKTTKRPPTGVMIGLAGGVGVALLYLLVIRPFAQMGSQALTSEITERLQRLKQLQLPGQLAPTPSTLTALQAQHGRLEASYRALAQRIDPTGLPQADPAQEPGLYFGQRLHTLQKDLERRAIANHTTLPQSLGLSEELPRQEDVPWLLKELELVELVVTTLMDQQVQAIELIKVVPRRTIQGALKPLMTELGVQVRLKGTMPALMKSLTVFREASPVAAVPELSLRVTDDPAVLECELVVRSYVLPRDS